MNDICVPAQGKSGGLALLWPRSVSVLLQTFSQNHIDVSIQLDDNQDWWRFTGFYGEPDTRDFNEILDQSEKMGGPPRPSWQIWNFRSALDRCALSDLGFTGPLFTWCNGHSSPSSVRKRLDRACANLGWTTLFPNVSVKHEPTNCSDHAALLIRLTDIPKYGFRASRPWRFEAVWLQSAECEKVVADSWLSNLGNIRDMGVSAHIACCQANLTRWSATTTKGDKKRVQLLEAKLRRLLQGHITTETRQEIESTRNELERIAAHEEIVWRQRSKVLWLREGDRNTSFFHRKASHRFRTNSISKVHNSEGSWVTSDDGIKQCISAYFSTVYASNRPTLEDIAKGTEHLRTIVDASMQEDLLRTFTAAEVTKALFQMAPLKSPGPDGMSPIFFQRFWSIVKNDVVACVLNLLNSHVMPLNLNATNLVLIPKCKHPEHLSQFRPISLCNVVYKIASKAIANRMKPILDRIISPSQSAFVPGRLISDNILLAFEFNHFLNSKTRGEQGWMALKLDVSKAYDKVEWSFLQQGPPSGGPALALSFSSMYRVIQFLTSACRTGGPAPGVSSVSSIWRKITGWTEKILSQAGKEVLIKSVIQAVPTYAMGCFKLPITLLREIQGMIAGFWWGNQGKHKIHWLLWNRLCDSKLVGGLGFRQLHLFNLAMLAKHLWRIMLHPESLLSRILKARYFPTGDVFTATLGSRPSFTWRSIMAAHALFRAGCRWHVGSGTSIRVWADPWLPRPRTFWPITPAPATSAHLRVSDLMDPHGHDWDVLKIRSLLWPVDSDLILEALTTLPALSKTCPAPVPFEQMNIPGGGSCGRQSFRTRLRFLFGGLAVMLFLRSDCVGVGDWLVTVSTRMHGCEFRLFLCLGWSIWWCRNERLMKGTCLEPPQVVCFASQYLLSFLSQNSDDVVRDVPKPASRWSAPPPGHIKINFDGATFRKGQELGVGVFARGAAESAWLGLQREFTVRVMGKWRRRWLLGSCFANN
ncbi:UNVERIFIED_CONTAM: putative mitochondrial protein [Sesamum latifolium]|uniref:Mitochondrial protein n=1 Tax=Sesamum latifolium TaxID=2727402 RepID=A0AAW2VSG3_9LAMI